MRVLVFSEPGDFHTAAVKWALERLGAVVDVLVMSEIPQRHDLTLYLPGKSGWRVERERDSVELDRYDVVWMRRFAKPVPRQDLHPSDHAVALRDWRQIAISLEQSLARKGAFCVNHPRSAVLRGHKATQLLAAQEIGFHIPATLISTSEQRILAFISANLARGRETIAKPFAPVLWRTDGEGEEARSRDFGFMTELVDEVAVLESDVSSSPVIYQERVPKAYEVRVTIIGKSLFAVKLDSQSDRSSMLDFRKVRNWEGLGHSSIEIPKRIRDKLIELHSTLGVVFSTADLIVDTEGRWVFLEINEAGNWLWIEGLNSEIPLLDCFARFLISCNPEFDYGSVNAGRLKLADFTAFGHHIRARVDAERDAMIEPMHPMVFTE